MTSAGRNPATGDDSVVTWERPPYERLNGYVSFDRTRILVWCKRCNEVHSHLLVGQDGRYVAACNRKGGYGTYVIVTRNRFRTSAAEGEWVQSQYAARGLATPSTQAGSEAAGNVGGSAAVQGNG